MHINRAGENGNPPPRSSRIFNMRNGWYFATREGTNIGPFDSQVEANGGLEDFLEFIQLANKRTRQSFLHTLKNNTASAFINSAV